jgi:hypothetical protein
LSTTREAISSAGIAEIFGVKLDNVPSLFRTLRSDDTPPCPSGIIAYKRGNNHSRLMISFTFDWWGCFIKIFTGKNLRM